MTIGAIAAAALVVAAGDPPQKHADPELTKAMAGLNQCLLSEVDRMIVSGRVPPDSQRWLPVAKAAAAACSKYNSPIASRFPKVRERRENLQQGSHAVARMSV